MMAARSITNVVERATARADELSDDELRAGGRRLEAKVRLEVSQRYIGPAVQVQRPRHGSPPAQELSGGVALAAIAKPKGCACRMMNAEYLSWRSYVRQGSDKRLVTSIGILSLTNKTPGEHGRELYLRKQREILGGKVHLVEIDLLRGGEHSTAVPCQLVRAEVGPFDYHVLAAPGSIPDIPQCFGQPIFSPTRFAQAARQNPAARDRR